jgi:hypothetical protein
VEAELSTAVELLQKISDSARGEFEEGSEKQMREALQSIHVAAEQALTSFTLWRIRSEKLTELEKAMNAEEDV